MAGLKSVLYILICLNSFGVLAQSSKKTAAQAYRDITRLDISDIRKGKYLDYAYPYSVKQFIEYQALYGKVNVSRKWNETIIEDYWLSGING